MTNKAETSTDLVVFGGAAVSLQDQAASILERLDDATPLEARAIADDLDALKLILSKRGWALEQLQPLAEAKVQAERTIGRARASIPRYSKHNQFDWLEAKRLLENGVPRKEVARRLGTGAAALRYAESKGFKRRQDSRVVRSSKSNDVRTFDEAVGIAQTEGALWERLSSINDTDLRAFMDQIALDGEEITTRRVLYKAQLSGKAFAKRIEKGIYRYADGRLLIKYRTRGKAHSEILKTTNIITARRTLLQRQGLIKTKRSKAGAKLDEAYASLRTSLHHLDKLLHLLNPEARTAAQQAITHGHQMEDSIAQALKQTT